MLIPIFRFEKRHKNMSVHLSPCFRDVMVGDVVTVGECRYVHIKGAALNIKEADSTLCVSPGNVYIS